MKSAASYTMTAGDFGLVRHRAAYGSLVAESFAPAGQQPSLWTVTRTTARGWSESRVSIGELRKGGAGQRPQVCGARSLAAVIRAGRR